MGVAHLRGFRLNLVTVPVITMERCCLNAVVVLLQTPNLAPVFLRHCSVSSSNQNAMENSNLVFEISFHLGTSLKSKRRRLKKNGVRMMESLKTSSTMLSKKSTSELY
ncbi:hypothetical protein NC653_002268 [Populus alba x Populus x berolinensis]|uniref:Uncharacterized protein n=1 Tax=Populus alba x Populus x berolinensis TaxID=444605 RepID=A0AAD6RN83_9ROSI|nr:hypothetical protein NC653_002268 [Populus alba x Populus x berolinensis]